MASLGTARIQLTFETFVEGVEDSHENIDQNSEVERNITPERHVRGEPVQRRLVTQFPLPFHFFEDLRKLLEEVLHFGTLLILFTGEKDFLLLLHGQKFTQLRNRKDN